jgi:hypothetical protein
MRFDAAGGRRESPMDFQYPRAVAGFRRGRRHGT